MQKKRKIISLLIISILMQLCSAAIPGEAEVFAATTAITKENLDVTKYTPDSYIQSRLNYAFSCYGPEDFFTKNGESCTCHPNHPDIDCIDNKDPRCNCLRYVKVDGETVDLRSAQCMAYAMYIEQVLFGCIDISGNSAFMRISAPVTKGKSITASEVRDWFILNADVIHTGMHIRCNYSNHSIIVLNVDYEKGVIDCVDCNWGKATNCQVHFHSLTWAQYAETYHTISYAYVYKNYYGLYDGNLSKSERELVKARVTPSPTPTKSPTPTLTPKPANYRSGIYKVEVDNILYLRSDPSTKSEIVAQLKTGSELEISDFVYNVNGYNWGYVLGSNIKTPEDILKGESYTATLENNDSDGLNDDSDAQNPAIYGWIAMKDPKDDRDLVKPLITHTPTPTPVPAHADYPPGTYRVDARDLRVRESYTTNSRIIGAVPQNSFFDILLFVKGGNDMDWAQIELPNSEVYGHEEDYEEGTTLGWISMGDENGMFFTPVVLFTPTPTPTLSPTPAPTPLPTATPEPESDMYIRSEQNGSDMLSVFIASSGPDTEPPADMTEGDPEKGPGTAEGVSAIGVTGSPLMAGLNGNAKNDGADVASAISRMVNEPVVKKNRTLIVIVIGAAILQVPVFWFFMHKSKRAQERRRQKRRIA